MDVEGQREGDRHKRENFRDHSLWSMVAYQHQVKEQNALNMNKKLLNIIAERDAAIEERDRALLEKQRALEEQEAAMLQRNFAIKERNDAINERDNALNALQGSMRQPLSSGAQRRTNRLADLSCVSHNDAINERDNALNALQGSMRQPLSSGAQHETNRLADLSCVSHEMQILDALCRTAVESECKRSPQPKKMESKGCTLKQRGKRTSDHLKVKNDWDGQILGLNRVDYDDSIMPAPGCSCTGVFRQCYKWGNGGWQSSCCTTTMSVYPLPPVPNKRYARMGGRKMSGSAFSKLLSRLALEGFDFSIPVDLKDHWSKHGTNRYITIK